MKEILFTRQRHEADRAGLHYDVRLVHGDKAYSWATKKELPESGKSIILWEQPVHDATYALSKRVEIPKGQYGSGTTTLDFVRKATVEHKNDEHFTMTTKDGERYLFKKLPSYGEKAWLFRNLGDKSMSTKNKYLEKAASLFFKSKDEKIKDISRDFQIKSMNHFADHFNESIKDINKKFPKVDKSNSNKYLGEIKKTMMGNKKMYDSYKPIYEASHAKLKGLGEKFAYKDHKEALDELVKARVNQYASVY